MARIAPLDSKDFAHVIKNAVKTLDAFHSWGFFLSTKYLWLPKSSYRMRPGVCPERSALRTEDSPRCPRSEYEHLGEGSGFGMIDNKKSYRFWLGP